jgi:hypothetical protein
MSLGRVSNVTGGSVMEGKSGCGHDLGQPRAFPLLHACHVVTAELLAENNFSFSENYLSFPERTPKCKKGCNCVTTFVAKMHIK